MPRPGYIICAASGALDQYTNAVSIFNIIEGIRLQTVTVTLGTSAPVSAGGDSSATPVMPTAGPIVRAESMRIVATWIKEAEDTVEEEFQPRLVGFYPQGNVEVFHADFAPFRFAQSIHRLFVPDTVVPPLVAGLFRIECRLRRVIEEEWKWSQGYDILVEEIPPAAAPNPPAPAQGSDTHAR